MTRPAWVGRGRRAWASITDATRSRTDSGIGVERTVDRHAVAEIGQRALDINLVDEISTSDEYITTACRAGDVFLVHWVEHKKPIDRILGQVEGAVKRSIEQLTKQW